MSKWTPAAFRSRQDGCVSDPACCSALYPADWCRTCIINYVIDEWDDQQRANTRLIFSHGEALEQRDKARERIAELEKALRWVATSVALVHAVADGAFSKEVSGG